MEAVIEKECSALGGLFQAIIADMKASYPVWEDFISKAGKLQCQLRTTAVAVATFLDAFQKVADLATSTKGGTRDIGSALTRMCMRHRSIEAKLRHFSMAFVDCLISPLQEQLEDWKRGANTLDKDHAKEYKKARQEIKKKSSDTLKLQKKAKKGRGDIQPQLDSAVQDVNDKYLLLEETEKQAVRRVLVEERARFCGFVSMLRPVVDEEMSMLSEIIHLQTIADDLKTLTMDPHKLPPASEQVIHDVKGSDYSWSYQTPPSSPSTTMSRKSKMEAREELALALSRGLQLDTQRSSRDSLHCSSGYSTQTTTPCCSEDTIPSQVSDYDYFSVTGDHEVDQQDFDKSSTIPRNSDISQSYRKLFQAKRPASTAGLPSTPGPVIVTPGVATIRRTPSTKPSVRRAMPGIGPIPIKTPVIPVMTPTVPDVTGGIRTPGEEGEQPASPGSPTLDEDSEQEAALPVASWSGQASTNPPLPLGQQVLGLEALDGELEEDEDELDLAEPQGDTMLLAIRRGVKLKKTMTNDRSAPRFV
uniref:IMD domain-containing protein n=1 Tax=Electrophorus electricus TaxID=8005 RepID=A0AAY5E961_ELEEL